MRGDSPAAGVKRFAEKQIANRLRIVTTCRLCESVLGMSVLGTHRFPIIPPLTGSDFLEIAAGLVC